MKNLIGYILPDGTVRNLLDEGFKSHWYYEQYLIKQGELEPLENKWQHQIINLNQWIRINDGTNMYFEHIVELPIKGITEAQYKSLLSFLDDMMYANKDFIVVGIEEHSIGPRFTNKALYNKTFYFKDYLPDDIIKEIRQQYNRIKQSINIKEER